jgi:hypothetical protein
MSLNNLRVMAVGLNRLQMFLLIFIYLFFAQKNENKVVII